MARIADRGAAGRGWGGPWVVVQVGGVTRYHTANICNVIVTNLFISDVDPRIMYRGLISLLRHSFSFSSLLASMSRR